MLTLPAKVSQALRRRTRQPVLYVEIVKRLIDRLIRTHTDWTTASYVNGVRYVSDTHTKIVKEDTIPEPPARLQLTYPAQPGDPVAAADAWSIPALGIVVDQPIFNSGDVAGGLLAQTIVLTYGSEDAYPLSELVFPLKLGDASYTVGTIQAAVYDLGEGTLTEAQPVSRDLNGEIMGRTLRRITYSLQLLGISAAINVSTLTMSYGEKTFTGFSPAVTLVRGRRYLVQLYLAGSFSSGRRPDVRCQAVNGAGHRPTEQGGYLRSSDIQASRLGFFPVDGMEVVMRVRIAPYRFDGVTAPTRRMRIDLGQIPTRNGWVGLAYRTPGDSRLRVRLRASSDDFASESLTLGATDTHTLYDDGHDGTVAHVHDGDPITTLRRYYEFDFDLLGGSSFPAWAATTAKTVRAIVRPTVPNGFLYECTAAGNTGGSQPTWPTAEGTTVADGSVTWRAVSWSMLNTPEVRLAEVSFPSAVMALCSGSRALLGALPVIAALPTRSTVLDLARYISPSAEWSLRAIDAAGLVSRLGAEEHMRNLPIQGWIGYDEERAPITSTADLAPFFAGKIIDYTHEGTELAWRIQDRSKELNVRVPAPRATSERAAPPLDFRGRHLIDVIDQLIYSEAGTSRRWKVGATFAAAKAALGPRWITHRQPDEPTEVSRMVAEILEHIAHFLVYDEEGKQRLIQYPRSGASVATLTDTDFQDEPRQIESFATGIVNACLVAWGYLNKEFLDYVFDANPDAQNALEPGSRVDVQSRFIKGTWLGPESYYGKTLARAIARREVAHRSVGLAQIEGKTSDDWQHLQVGDLVSLGTAVFLIKGVRGTVKAPRQFMIIKKDHDFENATIGWRFIDASTLDRPPVMITKDDPFALSVSAGTAPFDVAVTLSGKWMDPDGDPLTYALDMDYDGTTLQEDYTGLGATDGHTTGANGHDGTIPHHHHTYGSGTAGRKRVAVRVTAGGAPSIGERVIRALAAPVAKISVVYKSQAGQPNLAILSGADSRSETSEIAKYEWDHTYVASEGFQVDAIGPDTVIPMPYQAFDVALRVTDDDGLISPLTIEPFTGKALAPPAPTNFQARQVEDYIQVQWNPNPDIDPAGSELQIKAGSSAVWDVGTTVVDEHIPGTTWEFLAPKPYGTYTLMLKFKDTTGNYSAAATSALLTTIDPQKRNVVVTRDEKALGWPGVKMNLIYEIAGDRWWLDETGRTIQDLPDTGTIQSDLPDTDPAQLWGTTVASGTYEQPFIDLLAVLQSRLWVVVPTTTLGDPAATTVTIEARLADTDTAGVPDWGAYSTANLGDIVARYVQIKVTVACPGGAANRAIENVQTSVDVPDIRDGGRAVTIPIGGLTITFNKTFHAIPGVNSITIHNMTTPLFYELVSVTLTALTVKIRRASDNADVGGLIDWSVDGY